MFYSRAVQRNSHSPPVTTEPWKGDPCHWGTEFLHVIYFQCKATCGWWPWCYEHSYMQMPVPEIKKREKHQKIINLGICFSFQVISLWKCPVQSPLQQLQKIKKVLFRATVRQNAHLDFINIGCPSWTQCCLRSLNPSRESKQNKSKQSFKCF